MFRQLVMLSVSDSIGRDFWLILMVNTEYLHILLKRPVIKFGDGFMSVGRMLDKGRSDERLCSHHRFAPNHGNFAVARFKHWFCARGKSVSFAGQRRSTRHPELAGREELSGYNGSARGRGNGESKGQTVGPGAVSGQYILFGLDTSTVCGLVPVSQCIGPYRRLP